MPLKKGHLRNRWFVGMLTACRDKIKSSLENDIIQNPHTVTKILPSIPINKTKWGVKKTLKDPNINHNK